jgi:secreted PhoX family phosphatase
MKKNSPGRSLFTIIALFIMILLAACSTLIPTATPEDEEVEQAAPAEAVEEEAEESPPEAEVEEVEEVVPTEAVEEVAEESSLEEAIQEVVEEEPVPEMFLPEYPISLDHPAAPFLESRAYAAANGGTAEWRKMEGVALDPVNNRFYMAITEITKGMSDGEGAIQLEENQCGAVYMGELDADYNVASLTPVVIGGPHDESNAESPCNPDSIAHPDNVFVDAAGRLWISEDSDGKHANDMLWVWNPDTEELKRFATVPVGAEVTGLYIAANGTAFMNSQHPSAENIFPYNRGTIGIVTGFDASSDFSSLPLPEGDERHVVRVAAGTYQVLGRAGDLIPGDPAGAVFGQIQMADGSLLDACNKPDGNMFLPVNEAGTEGYLYTDFECDPGGVTKLYIRQAEDGTWEVLQGENVNFMPVRGTRLNCFASVTPWNTGLTSEEGDPGPEDVTIMTDYLGFQANPYDYGWIVEMTPQSVGTDLTKHYAMGRFSHEVAVVMPDNKTVYFGDDTTDGVFFKFIADAEGDLSAGTLYGSAVSQNDDDSFDLEWVELGSGNDADIGAAIRELDPPS